MFNSTVLEVLIGLVFLYLIFSLLATIVNEIVATILKIRSNELKKAIQGMLDCDSGGKDQCIFNLFYDDPLLQTLLQKGRDSFPSYLEPKKFAQILTSALIKNEIKKNNKDKDQKKDKTFGIIEAAIEQLPDKGNLKGILSDLLNQSNGSLEEFQKNLEDWFNSVMDRLSGWYNRKNKIITFVVGLLIAIVFNFNSIEVYQRLSEDSDARKELVQYASDNLDTYAELLREDTTKVVKDSVALSEDVELLNQLDSLKDDLNFIVNQEIKSIESLAGIGWQEGIIDKRIKNSRWECARAIKYKAVAAIWFFLVSIWGWLITALAISLGAPFWFDLLNKLIKLRGTGKQITKKEKE